MAELNEKQKRFVEEYLIDLNATQAAIRAGYSPKTAGQQGFDLLKKPEIQGAIAVAKAARSERTEVTQDMVLKELARIGFSDLRNVLTATGNLASPHDWDDDTAASISSVEIVTKPGPVAESGEREVDHLAKIKVWDKNSALEKLGKHLGMFTDKLEVIGGVTLNVSKDDANL